MRNSRRKTRFMLICAHNFWGGHQPVDLYNITPGARLLSPPSRVEGDNADTQYSMWFFRIVYLTMFVFRSDLRDNNFLPALQQPDRPHQITIQPVVFRGFGLYSYTVEDVCFVRTCIFIQ